MKRCGLIWLLCLSWWAGIADLSARQRDYFGSDKRGEVREILFRHGDHAGWADPDYDDRDWRPLRGLKLPSYDGIYWVRIQVDLKNPYRRRELMDGLILSVVASYDAYWDGELIGSNGRVSSNPRKEQPGVIDAILQLPADQLEPGRHVLALRMSSHHTGFKSSSYRLLFEFGPYRDLLLDRARSANFSLMAVGAAAVIAFVFGGMWLFAARRTSLLLFSLLFLALAAMQGVQTWRWVYDYPYSWHYGRLVILTGLVTIVGGLLPVYLLHYFELRKRKVYLVALGGILVGPWLLIDSYTGINMMLVAGCLWMALFIVLRAILSKRTGAWVVLIGVIVSLVVLVLSPFEILKHALFVPMGPTMLAMFGALIMQLRVERAQAEQSRLKAARLEIELLKKNIQPHYLMNTLTLLMEVIEQQPKMAVELIDAIGTEFRILNRVSGERLIPLKLELEMCEAHLQVMSRRRGRAFKLITSGVEDALELPPALFLTLMENGFTHMAEGAQAVEFSFKMERNATGYRFVFEAPGARHEPPRIGGTGLRYVRARLDECFQGRWKMTGCAEDGKWRTVIEISGELTRGELS